MIVCVLSINVKLSSLFLFHFSIRTIQDSIGRSSGFLFRTRFSLTANLCAALSSCFLSVSSRNVVHPSFEANALRSSRPPPVLYSMQYEQVIDFVSSE